MSYKELLHKIEEISEDTSFTVGIVSLTIGPLIGPALSGVVLLIAFWDGLGRGLAAIGTVYPYTIALTLGVLAMGVFESLSIANMVMADRVRKLAGTAAGKDLDYQKAVRNKNGLFAAVMGLVIILEVLPALWGLWTGSMDVVAICARLATAVFPFVGRIAGSVFSQKKMADEVDPSFRLASENRLNEKRTLELKRQFAEDELRLEHDHKLQLAEAKLSAKLSKVEGGTHRKLATSGESTESLGESLQESLPESTGESLGKKIVRYLIANPGAKQDEIAKALGVSVPTVSREMKSLEQLQVLHIAKMGTRRVATVNGEHEKYLAN